MVNSADEPPLSTRLHSWAKNTSLSSLNPFRSSKTDPSTDSASTLPQHAGHVVPGTVQQPATNPDEIQADSQDTKQQTAPAVDTQGEREKSPTIEEKAQEKSSIFRRFIRDVNKIIRSSWINWLLVFVPAALILGAIEDWGHHEIVSPSVIFALNAVAIIPLASLLAFATESVAMRLGDTIGALLNVTFGNAVEIIIFILALVANEVRIVQAAAVGSILANLLLILGMGFVLGGLRFREQLYNPSMSQMSACLLSLSMVSLLLPTAFHAAFSNDQLADHVVLKVSRGTSVVLLLVYCLYLVFQLKSHAFMYESTPQHLIDEESHPGVLAEMLQSSSSSEDSSSSSSDSDSSHTTTKRIKRALRRRRRKSVSSGKDDDVPLPDISRTSTAHGTSSTQAARHASDGVFSGDEADGEGLTNLRSSRHSIVRAQDFEPSLAGSTEKKHRRHKKSKKSRRSAEAQDSDEKAAATRVTQNEVQTPAHPLAFPTSSGAQETLADGNARRPLNLRTLSTAVKPAFNSTVFHHHEMTNRALVVPSLRHESPRAPMGSVRRTSSMPDIHRHRSPGPRAASPHPRFVPHSVPAEVEAEEVWDPKHHLSKTSSVILLLASTGLVALCAEFLVGSINYMVESSGVSQAFIGLIILPIVGNAAEHVTAVTVAYKNKMDLSINIALGSSIQIALFVTPLMVMLGWAIGAEMSLYFSLFETVSLFASAFIVNYLMIDGRSNYLEGCLLVAAYIIISIAAFFYPSCTDSSNLC